MRTYTEAPATEPLLFHDVSRRFGAAGLAQLAGFAAAAIFAGLATVRYSDANDELSDLVLSQPDVMILNGALRPIGLLITEAEVIGVPDDGRLRVRLRTAICL